MSKLIIYHAHCTDGTVAAAVMANHFQTHHHPVELLAATYGDEPPPAAEIRGREVYIVDFSYGREHLVAMAGVAAKLVVLDHHKTAAEALAGLPFAQFDMARSGAGMAWDYCNPGAPRPPLVRYVEDRDLWRFAHGDDTRRFFAALSHDLEKVPEADAKVELARLMLNADETDAKEMMVEGKLLTEHFDGLVNNIAKQVYPVNLLGTDMLACNAPGVFASELGNRIVQDGQMPALIWYADGEQIKCMLRSADHLPDVSVIAQAFGGGGHRNAAGFRAAPMFFREIGVETPPLSDEEIAGHSMEAAGLPGVKVWDVRDGEAPPVAP